MSQPKMRPFEIQRQRRLMTLYDWGKGNLTTDDYVFGRALQLLQSQAEIQFAVTHVTALNYAKVVLWKLSQELQKVA